MCQDLYMSDFSQCRRGPIEVPLAEVPIGLAQAVGGRLPLAAALVAAVTADTYIPGRWALLTMSLCTGCYCCSCAPIRARTVRCC